ncbi:MAG: toll/interleukin-1 receptor domain-containing protein [Chloroflexota bacterium]
MKVFFSYASEDGPVVDQVYQKVTGCYPDTQVWLDKYQIVGGNDFIEKISERIRDSE